MARESTANRFNKAGQNLVSSGKTADKQNNSISEKAMSDTPKKDKIVSAKVYPSTWEEFTAINKAQGMTNNSVINMLISEYVREKKSIIK